MKVLEYNSINGTEPKGKRPLGRGSYWKIFAMDRDNEMIADYCAMG